ncbi:hypothetical protein N658DRAFT_525628 [Parathielavia hyrcaniae]|uniref:Uncharacterized protein n=1 Tax=Parathielavia hyrcaniae TaxID=113614 RepID=A0AAN6PYF5_9PEZI|nr:hypothetical protein N658DRAFT_525628 [Parathielavia hyrcaniae]
MSTLVMELPDSCQLEDPGDPDVAGLGVIIAFLISTCLALAMAIALYLRSAIPSLCNDFDAVIGAASEPEDEAEKSRFRRKTVDAILFDVLRSQNDQLLLLGLAITLSLYVRISELHQLSAYAFRMSTSTAWLTCVVNMCLLSIIRGRHIETDLRWRLIAMTLHLLLTAPLVMIASLPIFAVEPSLSVKCALEVIPRLNGVQITVSILQSVLFILIAMGGYVRRMTRLLGTQEFFFRTVFRLGEEYQGMMDPHPFVLNQRRMAKRNLGRAARDWAAKPDARALRDFLRIMLGDLVDSFLWEPLWLVFYFTFGLTSLLVSWTALPPFSQWDLSFGQLVPILSLLFFATPVYDNYMNTELCAFTASRREDKVSSMHIGDAWLEFRTAADPQGYTPIHLLHPLSYEIETSTINTRAYDQGDIKDTEHLSKKQQNA